MSLIGVSASAVYLGLAGPLLAALYLAAVLSRRRQGGGGGQD